MLKQINLRDWIFECDVEKTQNAYRKIPQGSAESCPCLYCKNFVVVRGELFQGEILELLEKFGVDCKKDAETVEVTLEAEKHIYFPWFHSIGKILQQGNPMIFDNDVEITFTEKSNLKFDVFERENLIQIEIANAVLPWMLKESPE